MIDKNCPRNGDKMRKAQLAKVGRARRSLGEDWNWN